MILSLHGLGLSLSGSLALKQLSAVLVHLDLVNGDLAGINAHKGGLAVDLLPLNALDVDDPAATVDLDNLALAALVCATGDNDLVVLADGQALDVVLGAELLGEGSGHHLTTDVGGGREVGLAALAAGRAHAYRISICEY